MTSDSETLRIVTLDDPPPADMVCVRGTDATAMLVEVGRLAADSHPVMIAPDEAAADSDDWIGIVSAAVVEGAVAVETRHEIEARRILTVHQAIVTGGEGPTS